MYFTGRGGSQGFAQRTAIIAQFDPLGSEGEMLAKNLQATGVQVDYKNYDCVTFEFFRMGAAGDVARRVCSLPPLI
ncbi:MAG: alpha/beta hydrolase fold domain-containing protein [Verrucomicrobiota bacterium]|nr:alpha/beta hydrolase fold domain-containing protein [Verrucomicrobiota bacterium]